MARKRYDADRRASAKFHKTKCKAFTIRFVHSMDEDIIEFIEGQDNKMDMFRKALRQYMAGQQACENPDQE